jgi:hypothetical protein
MAYTYKFQFVFTKAKVGAAPANTPVVDIIDRATGNLLVTGGTLTYLSNVPGLYSYDYSSATQIDAVGRARTTDATMDMQDVYSIPMPSTETAAALDTQGLTSTRAAYLDGSIASRALEANVQTHAAAALTAYAPATATAVWTYVSRTLTQTAAQIVATLSGTTLTIHRGDTLSISFTGLGNISTRTKLWFTLKNKFDDNDSQALIQIEETAGLMWINGVAGTSNLGSFVVTDAVTGAATLTLSASETAKLPMGGNKKYDVQKAVNSTITTLTEGSANIVGDVTNALG